MLMDCTKYAITDDFVDMDEDDPVYGYVAADKETKGGEARDAWLQRVRESKFLVHESNRLCHFLRVYKQLRTTNPDQKILVFSQYLKFLDIIDEAMRRVFQIQCLRFDGTVGHHQRVKVQQEFKDSDPTAHDCSSWCLWPQRHSGIYRNSVRGLVEPECGVASHLPRISPEARERSSCNSALCFKQCD